MELHPDPSTFGQPEVAIVAAPAPAVLPEMPVSEEARGEDAPLPEVAIEHVAPRTVIARTQAEQDRVILAADIRAETSAAVKATHGINVSILQAHSSYAASQELNGANRLEQTINVR